MQIAKKAINNLVGLNRIVFTFLVFGVYPWITKIDALLLSITKKAKAIYIATKEIYCL